MILNSHFLIIKPMPYPLITEYIESIKSAEDNFEELQNLRPVLDEDGEPVMTSGNFAVVFKMKDEQTGKLYAVKCFLREQEGREEAYQQISEELEYVNSSFLTPIKYLDKELFVDTNASDETEFPVLLMDWVEGKTLDKYIREHIDDEYELQLLAYQFSRLAMWLMPQPFAHGDLKPDNILVKEDGMLVLVDYDGMYVPAMKGQKARELGSPDFRHPSRTEEDFDEHIDDFSLATILLSLKAISLKPELLEQYGASDRLLFSGNDYHDLSESRVMDALKPLMQDAELGSLYSLFILAVSQNNLSLISFRIFNLSRPKEPEYENLSTEVEKEDLYEAKTDDYGVKYTKDGKWLIKAPRNIKNYNIKYGTKVICNYAFSNNWFNNDCELIAIKIPNSIKSIGQYAFNSCKYLTNITIPQSVRFIGAGAFQSCLNANSISVESDNTVYDSRNNCNAIIKTASNTLIAGCKNTIIPNSITSIGVGAFSGCSGLKEVTIPNSVISIGNSAFSGCSGLTEIIIPKNVTSIGENAFSDCSGLKKITIPNSVTEIGECAFEGCCSLKAIYVENGEKKRIEVLLPGLKNIIIECLDNVILDKSKSLEKKRQIDEAYRELERQWDAESEKNRDIIEDFSDSSINYNDNEFDKQYLIRKLLDFERLGLKPKNEVNGDSSVEELENAVEELKNASYKSWMEYENRQQ